jgi:hypothetical protein
MEKEEVDKEKRKRKEAKTEAKKTKLRLWIAKTRWNPCFGSSNEMACGHVMGSGVALSACDACLFVCQV